MQAFKQQKAANEPNIEAIQNEAQNAQQMAQKAMIERDAYKLSGELGIDLKTMPYVLKLADVSQVVQDGKIEFRKIKRSIKQSIGRCATVKTTGTAADRIPSDRSRSAA